MQKQTILKMALSIILAITFVGCDNKSKKQITIETNTCDVNTTSTVISPKSLVLTVSTTTLNKDDNTTVEVLATYEDNSTTVLTNVEWIVTPKESVEVNGTVLTAKKDNNVTLQAKVSNILSNTLNLTIVWVVNGYVLPPEPDPAVNNSTLLGIDVNGNGVRDDVERLIIIEEAKNSEYPKTQTAIALQYAWAWQKMIKSPTLETRQYLEKASACQWYFYNQKLENVRGFIIRSKWRDAHSGRLGVVLQDKIFNTKERLLQRIKFNEACSGNIFSGAKDEIKSCQTNIDELGE
ncbi:MAG: hypothetical protein GQ531_07535 [Sulfurovum sp.]|nr:hypothetical protein [Sulfurovum sp.]